MPLKLDVKKVHASRSDRVKCCDIHPTEPWMLVSLYNGQIQIWNFQTQQQVKTFEVCDVPVRTAAFIPRKNWVVAGSDDMMIRVFNYNTMERVQQFEAHSDYLRCIAVHPTQSYILTSSDDMSIKLWNWERKWTCEQVFEGHNHYVMQVVINPKDNNQFASASLDRTVKVWQLGSTSPNFTLEGHDKGVNCVDYYGGGDKPYLISGGDDRLIKIWDYQNKSCVQTLDGHVHNVSAVKFHPGLPIIISGSEDGTVRIWHANTYRLESTLNYGYERVWTISCLKGSNNVAIGYDEGSIMLRLGRDEPAMSMDTSGKIIWAKHSEIQQANLKAVVGSDGSDVKDGERLQLSVKDMGSSEVYPQLIKHSPNGRFVCVCGDGEFSIYTAMALRNKSFGAGLEFVWATDCGYAVRENNSNVKLFDKNFKERKSFKPDFGSEGIFGGHLLGVRSGSGLTFYNWDTLVLVRHIEIIPRHVYWSEDGGLVAIATDDSFFILRYSSAAIEKAIASGEPIPDDGVEDAFQVIGETGEAVKTGLWVGDCFIYTNSVNRLNYYVGGEIVTVSHLDKEMYLLGYISKDNRLYLGDKELHVVSFSLLLSVLEYQTAVMRRDFDTADKVLPSVPKEQRTRVANFLEKQGFKNQALAVTCDPEHKFELAIQLGDLKIAYQIANESESQQKWKQLADLAINKCEYGLAQQCLQRAQDYAGLLLLATSAGNAEMVAELARAAESNDVNNVAFISYFLLGKSSRKSFCSTVPLCLFNPDSIMVVCLVAGCEIEDVHTCVACKASLCEHCLFLHAKKSGHLLFNDNRGNTLEFCPDHFKEIDLFCEDCGIAFCQKCSKHSNHSVINLKEKIEEMTIKVLSLKGQMTALENMMNDCMERIGMLEKEANINFKEECNNALKFVENIKVQANELEKRILGILEDSMDQLPIKELAAQVISLNGNLGGAITGCDKFLESSVTQKLQEYKKLIFEVQSSLDKASKFTATKMKLQFNVNDLSMSCKEITDNFINLSSNFKDLVDIHLELVEPVQSLRKQVSQPITEPVENLVRLISFEQWLQTMLRSHLLGHFVSRDVLYICVVTFHDGGYYTINYCMYSLIGGGVTRKTKGPWKREQSYPKTMVNYDESIYFTSNSQLYHIPLNPQGGLTRIPINESILDGLTIHDGKMFVSASASNQLRRYKIGNWEKFELFGKPHGLGSVKKMSSSDEYLAVLGGSSSRIIIYGMVDEQIKFNLDSNEGLYNSNGLTLKGNELFVCQGGYNLLKNCVIGYVMKFKLNKRKQKGTTVIDDLDQSAQSLSVLNDEHVGILTSNTFFIKKLE